MSESQALDNGSQDICLSSGTFRANRVEHYTPEASGNRAFGMSFDFVFVTPAMAEDWLGKMVPNRKLTERHAAAIAKMILSGDFVVSHQSVAFNKSGFLIDGQHRLTAIVMAGKGIWIWVAYGVPDEAMAYIDTHKKRTIPDSMRCDGISGIGNREAGTAACMRNGMRNCRDLTPRSEARKFLLQHLEAIHFATRGTIKRGVSQAAVRAPIARAWYTHDRDRLNRFIDLLSGGVPEGQDDSGAVRLINFLNSERGRIHGGQAQVEIYRKTETALMAFLHRRPIQCLTETSRELFPLPEEAATSAA